MASLLGFRAVVISPISFLVNCQECRSQAGVCWQHCVTRLAGVLLFTLQCQMFAACCAVAASPGPYRLATACIPVIATNT